MIKAQNIRNIQRGLTAIFQSQTVAISSNNEREITWSNVYLSVSYEEMQLTRVSAGTENFEGNQQVYHKAKRIKIRKHNRTIDQTMRFTIDGETYYVTDVRNFIQNRRYLVIEGEARDND